MKVCDRHKILVLGIAVLHVQLSHLCMYSSLRLHMSFTAIVDLKQVLKKVVLVITFNQSFSKFRILKKGKCK